jgi:hypothetical protein
MPAFPSTVRYSWNDLEEAPDEIVERTSVERGIPKQRRVASDARIEFTLTLHFNTKAEAAAFETWFYTDIRAGQDWFDFVHPRTGSTVQARVVGGKLGPLRFQNPTRDFSTRQIKVEYWRSAW